MFLPEKTSETCTVTTECQSQFPRSFSKWFWLLQNIFEKFLENRVHFFKKCHDFLKTFRDFEKKVNSPSILHTFFLRISTFFLLFNEGRMMLVKPDQWTRRYTLQALSWIEIKSKLWAQCRRQPRVLQSPGKLGPAKARIFEQFLGHNRSLVLELTRSG